MYLLKKMLIPKNSNKLSKHAVQTSYLGTSTYYKISDNLHTEATEIKNDTLFPCQCINLLDVF